MIEKLLYIDAKDHEIPMQVVLPEGEGKFPTVLMLHGFLSAKNFDGHMLGRIAKALADNGIASARIDFASMGENIYPRDKYGLKVMIKEVEASFAYLQDQSFVDQERIGLLGHSLGGRIAFTCSYLPARLIVSLNGAVNTDEMLEPSYDKKAMEEHGYNIVTCSDGRIELLYQKFFDDMKATLNKNIYDFQNPILVCVADSDPTLDPNIGLGFIKSCGMKNVDHVIIHDANHTFNAKTGDYTKLNELIVELVPWIKQKMK